MKFDTIADIFSANKSARQRLLKTLADISDDEAGARASGEKWSINEIVEHLALVDQGIARICRKLIAEAKEAGQMSRGELPISPQFWERSARIAEERVEAPKQVEPSGSVSLSDSVEKLRENGNDLESLRNDLEIYDLSEPKFPHPYFGPINAVEWLVVAGGHEHRHTMQIERLLKLARKEKTPVRRRVIQPG